MGTTDTEVLLHMAELIQKVGQILVKTSLVEGVPLLNIEI